MAGKPKVFESPQAWLEHYAIPVPEAGCFLFLGAEDHKGYGKVGVRGVTSIASRASYTLFKGEIPDGMCVCHSCDTPLCVNPNHLFLATQKGNLADMKAKGRSAKRSKAVCKFGHPLERPAWSAHGICRTCQKENKRRYRERMKSVQQPGMTHE